MTGNLHEKIQDTSAHVGVIGMGYVGLPTMVAIADHGFDVTGIDINGTRVSQIQSGESYISDVPSATVKSLVSKGKLTATDDFNIISDLDIVLVCVPTPINGNKEPDLSSIEQATNSVSSRLQHDQLIILQSTTFPGTTQEIVQPRLEATGKVAGRDFFLAFALERIDPGNNLFTVREVPKVVGGITDDCTRVAVDFFSAFVDEVLPVSSPRVAEMTKLLENTFRSVNIALVNELAMLCDRMEIDIWEVIRAATTKPYGFMPFYPGPGVGGHCIPVDPFYLSWKAKEYDFYVNFIQLAAEINDNMPYYTLSRIMEIFNSRNMVINGSNLLILGVTFKENIADTRNSPALRVLELLIERGATVSYSDQNIPCINVNGRKLHDVSLTSTALEEFDATIILVGHKYYNLEEVVLRSNLVIDTKHVTYNITQTNNLVRL